MEEKIAYPCPCGGKIKWKHENVVQEGVDCGILDVEYCENCGEEYLPEESMRRVERKLKDAGLWGVERKEIKFWKSGNAVIVRFPADFAKKTGLDKSTRGHVYKDGERKLAIEF